MAILPDFEYDIFISYRHNDNRSGWVTEFVNSLKEELAATIKEPVSVYFDSNATDGLLENHNVDKSLEGKLKCLILIPILSQTYTDTRSFAWQHEFVAFNRAAQQDRFGRDIRLSNGNVASRILPIKIHDLDPEDQATIEQETASVLRAIEFIFKSPGVNRPLRVHEERPADNQNRTLYRDQINKVANAVKSIIGGLKYAESPALKDPHVHLLADSGKSKKSKTGLMAAGAIILLLISAAAFFYPRLSASLHAKATVNKSIAVLPFVNMSKDPDQEYFSDGLSEELLNMLAKVPDLKVVGRTSSFSFKGKNEDIRTIADKLDVANILEGSVRRSGNTLRITAQLISATDGTHLWSETYDRTLDDIFKVQDEIATAVVDKLKVTLLGQTDRSHTNNPEAYNLYLQGKYFYERSDSDRAEQKFRESLALDSTFASAWAWLALVSNRVLDPRKEEVYAAADKAIQLDPTVAEAYLAKANASLVNGDIATAAALVEKAHQLDPSNIIVMASMASMAREHNKMDEAIAMYRQIIAKDPLRANTYSGLGLTLYMAGRYTEAEGIFKKTLELNPGWNSKENLGHVLIALGKNDEALQMMLQVKDEFWRLHGTAAAYAAVGNRVESDKALKKLIDKYSLEGAYQIAEIYAFRKENDLAFQWLERAYIQDDPGLTQAKTSFLLKSIDHDPRWATFLKKTDQ